MNQLIYDFLHVTESAALASLPWIGTGNKIEADRAATNSMRILLNKISMDGVVVIGEGEIDEAPMLFIGERIGTGTGLKIDLAVDPIDGTTSTSKGKNDAITVIAAAPKGKLLHAPDMYMEKIATGPKAAGKIDIDAPIEDNLYAVAKATGKQINELTVVIQDRERHQQWIDTIRGLGAKTYLFEEGDVIPAIATCIDSLNIDLFLGIGGAPEGVLAAVGIKSLGGDMQARLLPKTDEEYERCKSMGIVEPNQSLKHEQLIGTDNCAFVATGITSNMLLKGIRCDQKKFITHSMVINGLDKSLRCTETVHSALLSETIV
ncbi:fructose-bisphosphatase class II [Salipaludibacillus neizhouensis]|uniref:Fructose-1,6-bisphosphatase n=1 Tax=Salipaludibacillus neizhouensis TaxID=885475 RepID=A0A3A9KP27_9BACI|nr:class II fructose-bisphosphatase [Salipaludibacillus neizhouensis]RKL66466.1 fructose-bisphosphatase class II [Salipaludibacillus neizhouensis]